MAAVTLTQDILAVCLLFADGEISLSMEKIIQRAENYQEKLNLKENMKRFFLESNSDSIGPESIKNFMRENNITEDILFHVSRPGEGC